ncbi:MAG: DUF5684 domain-containing protein [Flavobacteriales bacterium]|nr:DUF5684 domain-containing protein [Flavobacteriales bacterium]
MEWIHQILNSDNTGIAVLAGFLLLVGALAKWQLFVKANQPGIASLVPIWDLIVTLKIVGRPGSHILLFLIPVFNIYFAFRLIIELAQSFGKNQVIDYVFAIVFNIFYLLNLGLAYNEEFHGPVYGLSKEEIQEREARYATA